MTPIDAPGASRASSLRPEMPARRVAAMACLLALAVAANAWEHEGSKVEFVEYRQGIVEELRKQDRPYFLLFSAEWCFWCHEFGENTLTDERVADYLDIVNEAVSENNPKTIGNFESLELNMLIAEFGMGYKIRNEERYACFYHFFVFIISTCFFNIWNHIYNIFTYELFSIKTSYFRGCFVHLIVI